jgi:hypothetical protein
MPDGRQGTPFPFNGPVPPELLIDRQGELAELARRAADRVSVRLVAPRRFGKTSVAEAHAQRLREAGWRAAHVDLSRVSDMTDVARRVAVAYAAIDERWLRAHLPGLLGRIGITLNAAGPGVTLNARPPSPDAAAAESVLLPLLDLPKLLWEADQTPTLVVFDEFQDLLVAHRGLDGLLRSRIQYHHDAAAYVFAGSEPSMMREIFDAHERPFFGQALPVDLGFLPLDAVASELAKRFAAEGLEPGAALGELVAFAHGHPQRTMMLAYLLADAVAAGRSPTAALALDVITEAVHATEPAHEALWRSLGASERIVLAAASDGVAPGSRSLAEEHDFARTSLDEAGQRLADQGHLLKVPRASQVIDPLLAEWLRRR